MFEHWREQFKNDVRQHWPLLIIAIILDLGERLLEHRLLGYINGLIDAHAGAVMEWLRPVLVWIVHTPFLLVIATLCGIMIHAYATSREVAHAPANLDAEAKEETKTAVTYPRLTVNVALLQETGFSPASGVVLTNVGGSEAHRLHIDDMLVSGRKVTFPDNIPVLVAGAKTHPITPTIHDVGPMSMHDFMGLMADDWDTQNRLKGQRMLDILVFPAAATYEDHEGRKFLAAWQFEFHVFTYRRWRQRLQKHTDKFLPDNLGPFVVVRKIETKLIT